jgi:2-polyprenyl-6-methoxyphenol hydroxylase-like FAD-dependent oxidoreductase
MSALRVLVSGAGIAGPCLAYWLRRHGFAPTIVERAPRLRTGGYVIDFWGAGFDVADRMGIVPALLQKGYRVGELRQVDRDGRRVSGLDTRVFDRIAQGRFTSLARSDLAAAIYAALDGQVETIFDDEVRGIDERDGAVQVSFQRNPARAFDLVVGADGLHSAVRRLAFGEPTGFEKYLGLKVAAFAADGYRPRDELTYVVHTEVGQQAARFAMRDDRTMFLFVFADPDPSIPDALGDRRALLRQNFGGSGWECNRILDLLDGQAAQPGAAPDLYMDRVSQIQMKSWSRGRVALVGDAAYCVSLLAGQGSALAMVGAYILAGELKRAAGDHARAFAANERRLAGFMAAKQAAAARFASFFAPRSRLRLFLRNQGMKLLALPFVVELSLAREIRDRVELPAY